MYSILFFLSGLVTLFFLVTGGVMVFLQRKDADTRFGNGSSQTLSQLTWEEQRPFIIRWVAASFFLTLGVTRLLNIESIWVGLSLFIGIMIFSAVGTEDKEKPTYTRPSR